MINKLSKEAYENTVSHGAHGWNDEDRSFGDIIALIHSELSEALEEHRNKKGFTEIYYNDNNEKPLGIPIELADVVIRVFDVCEKYKIDLEKAIRIKMEYNSKRPFKHGGKII